MTEWHCRDMLDAAGRKFTSLDELLAALRESIQQWAAEKRELLSFFASADCELFSRARRPVAVRSAHVERMLPFRVSLGATGVIGVLRLLQATGRRFAAFDDLLKALVVASRPARKDKVAGGSGASSSGDGSALEDEPELADDWPTRRMTTLTMPAPSPTAAAIIEAKVRGVEATAVSAETPRTADA